MVSKIGDLVDVDLEELEKDCCGNCTNGTIRGLNKEHVYCRELHSHRPRHLWCSDHSNNQDKETKEIGD